LSSAIIWVSGRARDQYDVDLHTCMRGPDEQVQKTPIP
jgi:hypothetical protein